MRSDHGCQSVEGQLSGVSIIDARSTVQRCALYRSVTAFLSVALATHFGRLHSLKEGSV